MSAGAADRAETYLRLMAEGELRRALAYPRYEPPEPPGLPPAVQSAVHLSRPVFAPLLPPVWRRSGYPARCWGPLAGRPDRRVGRPDCRVGRVGGRVCRSAARQTPVGRAAEPVLWRTLRVRQAIQPPRPGGVRAGRRRRWSGLDRVRRVASALVAADALSEPAAQTVIESLTDALTSAASSGPAPCLAPGPGPGRWWGPGFPWRRAAPPVQLPAAPVQAVPIGTTLPRGPGADRAGPPARPGPRAGPCGAHGRGALARALCWPAPCWPAPCWTAPS